MADSYSFVKGGKLKLKGSKDKSHKKHKKHRKRKHEDESGDNMKKTDDLTNHGGWWTVTKIEGMTGSVCVEMGNHIYITCLDNGLFSLGQLHKEGEGPSPEEVLTAVKLSDTKIALKSGYDKYLSVDQDGVVVGRSDAIGTREQWEPVTNEGNMALCGSNNCFVSLSSDGDLVCRSKMAGSEEFIKIRSNVSVEVDSKSTTPLEERGKVKDTEVSYVKKFQSFQDRHLRVNQGDKVALKRAKNDGSLHEVMLDRRQKMKSDRYCK